MAELKLKITVHDYFVHENTAYILMEIGDKFSFSEHKIQGER